MKPVGFEILEKYLPQTAVSLVIDIIKNYKIHLKINQERKRTIGNYRHPGLYNNHRISINHNLNKYAFLITFIHEFAHLLCYEKYKNKVEPHGIEWKNIYSNLLIEFTKLPIFPPDILHCLQKTIKNPAATANGELELIKILKKYDTNNTDYVFIETIPENSLFCIKNKNIIYKKGPLRRKYFLCEDIKTNQKYLIHSICEVKLVKGLSEK